jgi:hypothetical protein
MWMHKTRGMPAWAEPLFDLLYLHAAMVITTALLSGGTDGVRKLYGVMALVLVIGDSFHLLPRILSARRKRRGLETAKGVGLCVGSVTMTVFYLLLYSVYCNYYGASSTWLTCTVWILAGMRVALCLFPQNRWISGDHGRWGIYRNLPFAALGLLLAGLFASKAALGGPLQWLWLAILLSFAFYLPVVLFAKKHPKLGMLMLPKTCTYIWMLSMGLTLS